MSHHTRVFVSNRHAIFLMATTLESSKRRFVSLDGGLCGNIPFSIVKMSRSPSTVFQGQRYDRKDRWTVIAEFQASGECDEEKTSDVTSDTLNQICSEGSRENAVYLVLSEGNTNPPVFRGPLSKVEMVSITDGVEVLFPSCFRSCKVLSRVTFGESSSLKRIGPQAFCGSGLREIHIPDSVEEVCDDCFYTCHSLSRVTFGQSSSLKRIGKHAFCECTLKEICIPDSVEELCEACFLECKSLSHVTLSDLSSLKHIGSRAFRCSALACFALPASVVSVGSSLFYGCPMTELVIRDTNRFLSVVGCLLLSRDRRVCYSGIGNFGELNIPDSVEEICDECFWRCRNLLRVTFGESSLLKRIGKEAFSRSGLIEIHIPSSVTELCADCFSWCSSLTRVTFSQPSSVKVIGKFAFSWSRVTEIDIPDSVEELCDECFSGCNSLSRVTFGELSSLKWVGKRAFAKSGVREIHIPGRIETVFRTQGCLSSLLIKFT